MADGARMLVRVDPGDALRMLGEVGYGRLRWSVTVHGTAAVVTDAGRRSRCAAVQRPWLDKPNDVFIAIHPTTAMRYRVAVSSAQGGQR